MESLKHVLIQKMVDIGVAKGDPRPFGMELGRRIWLHVPDIEAKTFKLFEAGIRTLFEDYGFASISVSCEVKGDGQKDAMVKIVRREMPDKKPMSDPYQPLKDPYEIPKDPYETAKNPSSIF